MLTSADNEVEALRGKSADVRGEARGVVDAGVAAEEWHTADGYSIETDFEVVGGGREALWALQSPPSDFRPTDRSDQGGRTLAGSLAPIVLLLLPRGKRYNDTSSRSWMI